MLIEIRMLAFILMDYCKKAFSMTPKTLNDIERGCVLLDTENQSFTVRYLISLGLEHLEKQKKEAV